MEKFIITFLAVLSTEVILGILKILYLKIYKANLVIQSRTKNKYTNKYSTKKD